MAHPEPHTQPVETSSVGQQTRASTAGNTSDLQFKSRTRFKDSTRAKVSRIIEQILFEGEAAWRVYKVFKLSPMTDYLVVTSARLIALDSSSGGEVVHSVYLDEIGTLKVTRIRGTVSVRYKNGQEIGLGSSSDLPAADLRDTVAHGQASGNAAQIRQQEDGTESTSGTEVDSKSKAATRPLLSSAVFVGRRTSDKAMRTVAEHTHGDEQPWLVIGSGMAGVFVAFSDRVMIVKVGGMTSFMAGSLGGGRVTTFMLSEITGIEYNGGFATGVLEILTASYQGTANKDYWRGTGKPRNADSNDPFTLSNTLPLSKLEYQEATPHLNRLRKMIAEAKNPVVQVQVQASELAPQPALSGSDITSRLAQLVQMKEAGHLTPEEFEDAKRQALSSMS